MKNIFLFLVFIAFTDYSLAQKGYRVIRKAETKYLKGQNGRALRLLSKAEKMDYGFCGNAWLAAEDEINFLRAKIYINEREFKKARASLDAMDQFLSNYRHNIDSIRIRIYQLEYGKDSLRRMIDSSFTSTKVDCGEYRCYAIVPLSNGDTIRLRFNSYLSDLVYKTDSRKLLDIWLHWFKGSEHYKLLME